MSGISCKSQVLGLTWKLFRSCEVSFLIMQDLLWVIVQKDKCLEKWIPTMSLAVEIQIWNLLVDVQRAKQLADDVKEQVKALGNNRHKIVVQVAFMDVIYILHSSLNLYKLCETSCNRTVSQSSDKLHCSLDWNQKIVWKLEQLIWKIEIFESFNCSDSTNLWSEMGFYTPW